MLGRIGKLIASLRASEAAKTEILHSDGGNAGSPHASLEVGRIGSEKVTEGRVKPDDSTSVAVMLEILKLLARIEYGLDVAQIAESLAISPEDTLVNCVALDEEALIHHHEELKEWFIGQRGLDFLRLNNDLDSKM